MPVRAGHALRWIVVTPTFAAGMAVMLAAALAGRQAPMVLSTVPDLGTPCQVKGCDTAKGKGTLAIRPGTKRLVNPPSGSPVQASQRPPAGAPSGSGLLVRYRTVRQGWGDSFMGEITLASRASHPDGAVTLRFSYPAGQLRAAWADTPMSHDAHTVTVWSGQHAGRLRGGQLQVVFSVSGPAGPPATCTINAQPCHLTTR